MIPEHVIAAANVLIKRDPVPDVPKAVKTIREHAGLSQTDLARKLHVQRPAVANWETGFRLPTIGRTASILKAVGLAQLFDDLVTSEHRPKLDRLAYQDCDADSLENDFFIRTRGELLEKITNYANAGNPQFARIYLEWMSRNEARIAARESKAVPVRDDAQSMRSLALSTVKGRRRIAEKAQDVVDDTQSSDAQPVSPIESING